MRKYACKSKRMLQWRHKSSAKHLTACTSKRRNAQALANALLSKAVIALKSENMSPTFVFNMETDTGVEEMFVSKT